MAATAHNPATEQSRRRPWPQVAVALLLLGQIAGAGVLEYFHLATSEPIEPQAIITEALVTALLDVLSLGIGLAVIIIVALAALLAILRWWRSAWMLSMLVQMLTMIVGLALYFGDRPFYTYLIMLYAVLVVGYLVLPGVQAAFLPRGDAA